MKKSIVFLLLIVIPSLSWSQEKVGITYLEMMEDQNLERPPNSQRAAECVGGEQYDDGVFENGYSGNPALVSDFSNVQKFTPSQYPFEYTQVCVPLVTLSGTDLNYNIVVYDDDGMGGLPGTELASIPVSAAGIPGALPAGFYDYDVTGQIPLINDGSIFIGVNWDPMVYPSRFIASDESVGTPLHESYVSFDATLMWTSTESNFPGYRALGVRAEGAAPPPIPTMGQWGIIILGLSLFIFGVAAVSRRQKLAIAIS